MTERKNEDIIEKTLKENKIKDETYRKFGIREAQLPNKEESLEILKDIYKWKSYPVMMLFKITEGNYIQFGFILAGLETVVRLENLLRGDGILDFCDTKKFKSAEYTSIEDLLDDGWRVSPEQPKTC